MANKKGWHKEKILLEGEFATQPINIVNDAGIANKDFDNGKLVPLLILDTTTRPDIDQLIENHGSIDSGLASTSWTKTRQSDNYISLLIQFSKPVLCTILLEFYISKYGGIIDSIIESQAMFIQAGRKGDRFITTQKAPRVLIQVPKPDGNFEIFWNELRKKSKIKEFRKLGYSKKDSKELFGEFEEKWKSIYKWRFK
jgi:hypothetical protein